MNVITNRARNVSRTNASQNQTYVAIKFLKLVKIKFRVEQTQKNIPNFIDNFINVIF